ncbi:MAG: allophanate hydrolase, partial [Syntrophobacteraceae bacterium]
MEREQRATDVAEALGVADLGLETLRRAYTGGETTPRRLMVRLLGACGDADPTVWVRMLTEREIEPYLARLDSASPEDLPLYGVPFAIKDNIDLAGIPTTAACPAYAYTPERSAFVVERLVAAGAVPVGKTNMDQFATGLVGVRSPYGACRNSFDPDYIAGGSSSGSALAVALGLASFALGTDTAGSGRVPAAFNNLVGLKPSRGALSASGVVPACRSLDCVSVFTLSAGDARDVLRVAAGPDDGDPYSREAPWLGDGPDAEAAPERFRFGVPRPEQLEFFGNRDYAECFAQSIGLLEGCGGEAVEVDFEPFLEAARLLYEGPWVAERYAAVGAFIEKLPQAVHPVTLEIIRGGASATAADAFRAMHRLQALKKSADAVLGQVDFLLTPTAGTCYMLAEVSAEPIACNSRLGYYTNYVNLLDYCALAAPAAFAGKIPFGVTLVGPVFSEP